MPYVNRMLLLIQIGDLCNIDKIMNIVLQYNISSNIIVFTLMENLQYDFSQYNLLNYHVMYHQNKGMDIGPYLLQIKWVLNNYSLSSFDYIFKLHTKSDLKWFDEMINPLLSIDYTIKMTEKIYIAEKWSLKLDNLNTKHINLICDMYNFNNIYYDIIDDYELLIDDVDELFYSNYYDVPIYNCSTMNNLLNTNITKNYILNHAEDNHYAINEKFIKVKQRKPVIYAAGSIFIIQYNLVYEHFSQIDIDTLYNQLEIGCIKNQTSTFTHALERIISSFFL